MRSRGVIIYLKSKKTFSKVWGLCPRLFNLLETIKHHLYNNFYISNKNKGDSNGKNKK